MDNGEAGDIVILRLGEGPPEQVGGKALGLARLVELGLPVPPALVVPVSALGVIENPREVAAELGEPLAVRSSGVGEDAADRSAAGQYDSLMNITAAGLAEAVQRVFASADTARARSYGAENAARMAVVIQRQIEADRAGVAFSVDPLDPNSDEVMVEAVFGHGESLVSGQTNPDRFWVAPDDSVRARLATKSDPYRLLRTLRDDEAVRVANLTRQAANGFGRPVDVEFCFQGGELWLVQCRAITTL